MQPCPHCKEYEEHAPDCATVAASLAASMTCSDCGGALHAIRMWLGPGATPTPYSEIATQRSWITGAYNPDGYVYTFRCDECRGVRLYAVPNTRLHKEMLPIPAQHEGPGRRDLPLPAGDQGES
jgi:hypothetical protein